VVKQSKSTKERPAAGFLETAVRVGDAPWRLVDDLNDLDPLRPQTGEGVSDVRVVVSIAKKGPPLGENYLPGYGGPTLREIQFWVRVPQDENILASVLLYCWQQCIDLRPITIKDALAQLARVAASQGWVNLSDVIKETRKLNTGGRPLGTFKKDTTVKFEACFTRLKSANPQLSDMAILEKVAAETGRSGWSKEKKDNHRTKVKKALQRRGLLPVTHKKPSGQ
jgi:hypothetical protein